MSGSLVSDPDQALDPNTAYRIMSAGMRKGLFTGVAIGLFIDGTHADYLHARKVINRMDQAQEIADDATLFEAILNASWRFVPAASPHFQLGPF